MIHVYLAGFALALTALSILDYCDRRMTWTETFWNLMASACWFLVGPVLAGICLWIAFTDRVTVEAKLKAWGMLP